MASWRFSVPGGRSPLVAATLLWLLVPAPPSEASSLQPTRAGLMRQAQAAREHRYPHFQDEHQVKDAVRQGELVHLPGDRHYRVNDSVSFPYARPEVRLFVERLASQYHRACGEQLVVTSLVRPMNRQPPNSTPLSVHPTGMALDLRVSTSRACRTWLEASLVGLKRRGVLEAARERNPPHYHVVVFPRQYSNYLVAQRGVSVPSPALQRAAGSHVVRPGDSLWSIARRHGTTVPELQRFNQLSSTRIQPGQVLEIPAR